MSDDRRFAPFINGKPQQVQDVSCARLGSVYQSGYEAGAARKDIDSDNPYTVDSHWWQEWRRGYHDATR